MYSAQMLKAGSGKKLNTNGNEIKNEDNFFATKNVNRCCLNWRKQSPREPI